MFQSLLNKIHQAQKPLHGIYIAQGGQLLLEEYFMGKNAQSVDQIYSCSKAISAFMVGQALEVGSFATLETPIEELFPEYSSLKHDKGAELTLHHFLSQTTGFRWLETGRPWDSKNALWQMEHSENWMDFLFSREIGAHPGQQFNYNTGVSNCLSYLIERICGIHPEDFFQKYLASPLGFQGAHWKLDPQGYSQGGKGLHLSLNDMAKFGQMVLNGGLHQGKRLVSQDWIQTMLSYHSRGHNYYGAYGYHWWLRREPQGPSCAEGEFNIKCAVGFGGNFIYLIPEWDALVVISGHLVGPENFEFPQILFREEILPALSQLQSFH